MVVDRLAELLRRLEDAHQARLILPCSDLHMQHSLTTRQPLGPQEMERRCTWL